MNLKKFIKVYDDAIPDQLCTDIVAKFESDVADHTGPGGQPLGTSYIGNTESHWTELNVDGTGEWSAYTSQLIDNCQAFTERYSAETGANLPPRSLLETFRIKRYKAADSDNFSTHIDADCLERSARYLVFIWYLSDVQKGGETKFFNINMSVKAKKGRLLVFPPYWLFPHAGRTPISDDKYIVGTFTKFAD